MNELMASAAQVIIAIIPIVGIVMGSIVIFFYLLWHHKRRTLLIKAGHFNKQHFDFLSFSLLSGLLLSAVGIALTVLLVMVQGVTFGLLGGLIPLSCGSSLLAYFFIRRGGKVL